MSDLKPITMESGTFALMKKDMTDTINKLIRNMMEYKAEEASMTVKLTIKLSSDKDEVIYPKFKHKVSCTVQQKDETAGELGGGYTLEQDENGTWGLQPIQMEMLF